MKARCLSSAVAALVLISSNSASRAAQSYSYTTINVPPAFNSPSANNATFATGINNVGQISGRYFTCCVSSSEGFLLSGGNFSKIIPPTGNNPIIGWINDLGHIVGSSLVPFVHYTGFLYNGSSFISIDYPGSHDTSAYGINDADQVVGFYDTATTNNGFIEKDGIYSSLTDPLGIETYALGINNAGDVVGRYNYNANEDGNGYIYI